MPSLYSELNREIAMGLQQFNALESSSSESSITVLPVSVAEDEPSPTAKYSVMIRVVSERDFDFMRRHNSRLRNRMVRFRLYWRNLLDLRADMRAQLDRRAELLERGRITYERLAEAEAVTRQALFHFEVAAVLFLLHSRFAEPIAAGALNSLTELFG